MTSFVALLRGVNVGGKNLIPMKVVSASFADVGYRRVRTHGQSGNALFDAKHAGPGLEGVDSMSVGPGVLYFSRVATQATKTRVQRVMAMPMFQQMTVRTWRVTTRLLDLLADA